VPVPSSTIKFVLVSLPSRIFPRMMCPIGHRFTRNCYLEGSYRVVVAPSETMWNGEAG
jgi:hypothetical protein